LTRTSRSLIVRNRRAARRPGSGLPSRRGDDFDPPGHADPPRRVRRRSLRQTAEKAARFLGTPQYLLGQTVVVCIWILLNTVALIDHWDPYPFILLNLAFSTQAAYAAPLILLAQTRQADRDKHEAARTERRQSTLEHGIKRETDRLVTLLESNTTLTQQDKELTEQVAKLTREIHAVLTAGKPDPTD
jgi:uncharacterized membrane protein